MNQRCSFPPPHPIQHVYAYARPSHNQIHLHLFYLFSNPPPPLSSLSRGGKKTLDPHRTHRLQRALHDGLDPSLERITRTLDIHILEPHARRISIEADLDARDGDAQGSQALDLCPVFCRDVDLIGGTVGFGGGCGCAAGEGDGRGCGCCCVLGGGERGKQRGGARVADGGYGVFAELGFYEEEEPREARGGVGGGVRVGGFEALGEVVVGAGGFAVCVRVRVRVGVRVGRFCGWVR